MGYNTYLSLPKLHPGRKNMILTHGDLKVDKFVEIYHDKQEVLQTISQIPEDIYVIGDTVLYE